MPDKGLNEEASTLLTFLIKSVASVLTKLGIFVSARAMRLVIIIHRGVLKGCFAHETFICQVANTLPPTLPLHEPLPPLPENGSQVDR